MRSVKGVLVLGVCFGLVSVSLAQRPSMVGGWKVELSGDEEHLLAPFLFLSEMLRIRPDGTYHFYRIDIEGDWSWRGDDLVLKPTKVRGQSLDGLSEYLENLAAQSEEEVFGMDVFLVDLFGGPMIMRPVHGGGLVQSIDKDSLVDLKWVRVPDPPLLDRLKGMDQAGNKDDFDFSLYKYYYDSIYDNVEGLAPELDKVVHDSAVSPGSRWWAAVLLGYSKEYDVVKSLTKGLVSEEGAVRAACAIGLDVHRDPTAIPAMIEAYRSGLINILLLCNLIKRTNHYEAAPFLLEVITSGESRDRKQALSTLAGLKLDPADARPEYVAVAIRFLDDEDTEGSGKVAAARVLMAFSSDEAHRDRAIEVLKQGLSDAESSVRIDALKGLAESGSAEAIPFLIDALRDSEWGVRQSAARHLADLDVKDAIDAIEQAWSDEDNGLAREAMYQALKKLREKARLRLALAI